MTTKRRRGPATENGAASPASKRAAPKEVVLPATLTVKQLGDFMRVNPIDVIKQLMRNGVMAAINQVIDYDLAVTVTPAFGFKAKKEERVTSILSSSLEELEEVDKEHMTTRGPVVTILGHVDHGKTTLLDTIRNSHIAESEVGGITQHIGAYQVDYRGRKITFLDTPGHEAFTAIRARGAQATDMAVLVVAADDGVMPQTVEAINHAKAANLPTLVAINKMDRPDANPETVKRQLGEHGLVLEEWGGDVITVPISAKNNQGIDELLENILVVAEVSELKANYDQPATGVIIEVKLDRNRGPLATVLVKNGTLHVGDTMVAGTVWGRVRALINDTGLRVKDAEPSVPVEVLGFSSLPQAGDKLYVVADDRVARGVVKEHILQREEERNLAGAMTLEGVMSSITSGEAKELNLIIKADVQGSVEAVRSSLERQDSAAARVNILHAGSGAVNEGDVLLASASNAIILGFNVTMEPSAEMAASRERVEVRTYDIIYKLIEDVEKALKGILEPAYQDVIQGRAEVRAVFRAGKAGKAAGVMIIDGRLTRGVALRVVRGGEIVHEGSVSGLRRFKNDVNEVTAGFECGVSMSDFQDFEEGDVLEAHRRERTRS